MIQSLIRKHYDDEKIYEAICDFMNVHFYPANGLPENEGCHRATYHIKDVITLIGNRHISSLVDIGCSHGSITRELGRCYGLSAEALYGVDIIAPYKDPYMTYIQTPDYIPISDNSIDVVTMLMSLHHIRDPLITIHEAYRILKEGGIVIIKEHDIAENDNEARTYLDILHGLYCKSWCRKGCEEDSKFCETYWAHYRPKELWTSFMELAGFSRITTYDYLYRLAECSREYKAITPYFVRHIRNIGYSYWGIYEKKASV
jgi:SAM-dependent methyltransferase